MAEMINLQIASFAGLGLPRTFNKPVRSSASVAEVVNEIFNSLPSEKLRKSLIISTIDGHRLLSDNETQISSIAHGASILPLRLSARLCGGKGGFGSQLRAAGGRMSGRKNRDRENANGSNRNLDGRRLRTVNEAQRLAQYLESKPEMDRQEREEKRKRWEAVVKAADETEERIKSGQMGSNHGRLNAEYVESKELAEERIREAIARAAKGDESVNAKTGSESSEPDVDSQREADSESSSSSSAEASSSQVRASAKSFYGWDEDDEDEDEADGTAEDEADEGDEDEDEDGDHKVKEAMRRKEEDI